MVIMSADGGNCKLYSRNPGVLPDGEECLPAVAAGCDAGLSGIPVNQPRAQAASFAAAARYFEEMARIAREAEHASPPSDPCVERIDCERLAKAVVNEMNRAKPEPPPRVTPA